MNKYLAIFKISVSEILAEKETLIIWSLSSGLGLLGITAVFLSGDRSIIGGFTKPQLVSYYFAIFMLEQIIGWFVFWDIREKIMDGTISNFLLKPVIYVFYQILHEFAYKIVNLLTQILVSFFIILLISKYLEFNINIVLILKLIPAILIGSSINFLAFFLLGCFTFFWTESYFLSDVMWIISLIFNGQMLPLSFFPQSLNFIIQNNPFRFTYYLSTEIIFGKLPDSQYWITIGFGFFWVIILAIITFLIWKAGLKRFSAFGA